MEVKAKQIVKMWDDAEGIVLSTTEGSAHIKLTSGKHIYATFDKIVAAVDTFTEKEAKFLGAKDKLAAYKEKVATTELHPMQMVKVIGPIDRPNMSEEELSEKQNIVGKQARLEWNLGDGMWRVTVDGVSTVLHDDEFEPINTKTSETIKTEASKKYAPGKVDEPKWKKAEEAIAKSTGKSKSDFGDSEWAQVNSVYQNMGGTFHKKESAKRTEEVEGTFTVEIDGTTYELEYSGTLGFGGDERAPQDDIQVDYSDMPNDIYDDNWEMIQEKAVEAANEQFASKKTASIPEGYSELNGWMETRNASFMKDLYSAYVKTGLKGVVAILEKELPNWTADELMDYLNKEYSKAGSDFAVWLKDNIDDRTFGSKKTAGYPVEEGAQKYPVGTILTTEDAPQSPETSMITVLKYDSEKEEYTLNKRPYKDGDAEENNTHGVRFEMSKKELENDKKLKVFSSVISIEAGKPSDLSELKKEGSNIVLCFKEFDATYSADGVLVSTAATEKQFSNAYRKEFGLMVKNNGYDKLATAVMQKRIASKLKKSAANEDVATKVNAIIDRVLAEWAADAKKAVDKIKPEDAPDFYADFNGEATEDKEGAEQAVYVLTTVYSDQGIDYLKKSVVNAVREEVSEEEFSDEQLQDLTNDLDRDLEINVADIGCAIFYSDGDNWLAYFKTLDSDETTTSKRIASKLKKAEIEFPISFEDTLMAGITFQELIDTVYSDEKVKDEKAFRRIFKDIVKFNLEDAEHLLTKHMDAMIKEANKDSVDASKKTAAKIPTLKTPITEESVKEWAQEMVASGLSYHLDDDPYDIINYETNNRIFTDAEASQIEKDVNAIREAGLIDVAFEVFIADVQGGFPKASALNKKAAVLRKKAARLGNYDFNVTEGRTWKLEAGDDGKPKLKRVQN